MSAFTSNMNMNEWDSSTSNPLTDQQLNENFEVLDDELNQRGVNIRWKGADPSGITSSYSALLAAIQDDTDTIFVPKGVYLIDQNLTIPSSKKLVFERNARFLIAANKTLTINSAIDALITDWIFDISLGGIVAGAPQIASILPHWFGAKGNWNGSTGSDDTSAIQAALNLAGPNKLFVNFAKPGYYQVTKTLFLGSNAYISGCITGFSTLPGDSISHCSIIFNQSDPDAYLFTGKGGVAGGQIIMMNIGVFTGLNYYPEIKKNIFLYKYNVSNHSLFEGVQIGLFDYVFYNGAFSMASRIHYCEIRNIGRAVFYRGQIVDAYIYNNYFHGSGTSYISNGSTVKVSCDFAQDNTTLSMSQFINNWFEFFDYVFKLKNMEQCTFIGNMFDYIYRVFEKVGVACSITGNVFNHCDRNSMITHKSWSSSAGLADTDWRSIVIEGYTGVSIVGNIIGAIDTFIDIVGGNGGIRDVYTAGNIIRSDSDPYTPANKDRLVRVSIGASSWLKSGHMSNVKLEELNDTVHTAPPQSGLFPGRRVVVNGQTLTLDTTFKWRDANGSLYGFTTKNLIPKLNDTLWSMSSNPKWIVDSSGYKVTVNGYSSGGWYGSVLNLPTSGGRNYRFNSETAYYASDGTHRNIIEIYLFQGSNKIITYYYKNGEALFFTTPTGTDRIQIALRCNVTNDPTLTFTFDTLFMSEYSELNYGTIVRTPSGKTLLKYYDETTNVEVYEPYI
ncbi:hypothetical protein PCCS19_42460 [Paenibacillus sp. CCS19]|uniref:hypothetical protein n=1 Tax=Paenibacillus sp. CCS19 TaxID=3158387 RepID=UPI00256C07E1|nr:hypothetical protein [Paenibacillus cellulosilyticus]GMK41190.1 hypothetical protein PCCS19_42460 [Paenibacillus cellulosilyticus]